MDTNPLVLKLLESYKESGGLNDTAHLDLPSRSGTIKILKDTKSLLFPGYHEEAGLDPEGLRFTIAETANRLGKNLVTEVKKALRWGCRVKDCKKGPEGCQEEAQEILKAFYEELPTIRTTLLKDVQAAYAGDPAAKSMDEVILSYPGMEALIVHRIAHFFWINGVALIPRMMSEYIHGKTGIDIHPGATIGESFFIDHGTGVVIGETCVIGKNVKIYQGVTLGALSVKKTESEKKRHPTLEDGVTIYAGATILGGSTVIGENSTVGGNTWITESIAKESIVFNSDSELIKRSKNHD